MKVSIYDKTGKEVKEVELPESIFNTPWNGDLVHQVVVSMQSNKRQGSANTKDRGEVSGGGKKPWKQKGTGRARHGSRRSPIWIGGGVTHGPINEKDYSKKINKNMKRKALKTVLSKKFKDGEIIFIDSLSFDQPKTKSAKDVLNSLSKVKGYGDLVLKRKNAAYVATSEKNDNSIKSFSNFGNLKLDELRNINVLDLVNYKYLIIENPEASLKLLEK